MSQDNNRRPPSIGLEVFSSCTLTDTLDHCKSSGVDFAVLPLVHPRCERLPGSSRTRAADLAWPVTRSDTLLTSEQWSTMIVGRLSRWINLDSTSAVERRSSEAALKEELAWASHLSLSAVLVPQPKYPGVVGQNDPQVLHMNRSKQPCPVTNYARQLNQLLISTQLRATCWVEMDDYNWHSWNRLRMLCEYNSSIQVCLRLNIELIEKSRQQEDGAFQLYTQDTWNRWFGEPVRCLLLSMKDFTSNLAGYPTLPPATRKLVVTFYERGAQFVLTGKPVHANGVQPYQMYLHHLCATSASKLTQREEFEYPFYDYLQVPLQPLGDHLESQTYETFEKDPVKYERYQQAIEMRLQEFGDRKPQYLVLVVGAGRGPLIRAALRGADSAKQQIRVIGIEKNPNAIITLLNAYPRNNPHNVEIIARDMRHVPKQVFEQADLIVSELLGSWGDNELSPECLYDLLPANPQCFSIPHHYDSFVAPISSHKIWSDICNLAKGPIDTDPVLASGGAQRFETPYVVRLFNFYEIAAPQVCFTFEHPEAQEWLDVKESEGSDDLERYTTLEFQARADSVLHGFAGYFTAYLCGENCKISILPDTFSEGMFSWFPLFLPIRHPIPVKQGETISASFWRRRSPTKVWYEWSVQTEHGTCTPIHNPNGRSYAVNLMF